MGGTNDAVGEAIVAHLYDEEAAEARVRAAWAALTPARHEASVAECEWARLLALKIEGAQYVRFSREFCYDDQGSYFLSTTIAIGYEGDEEEYDDSLMSVLSNDSIDMFFSTDESVDEGTIDIADLRTKTFGKE